MKKRVLTTILAAVIAQPVMANNTIFSCLTKNNKEILVKKIGQNYEYSFGKKSQKEIAVTNSIEQVLAQDYSRNSSDTGGFQTSLAIQNNNYLYVVYERTDKSTGKVNGGVEVYKGDTEIANVKCSPKSKIISNFDYDRLHK